MSHFFTVTKLNRHRVSRAGVSLPGRAREVSFGANPARLITSIFGSVHLEDLSSLPNSASFAKWQQQFVAFRLRA